jgi:sterol desaturase/sphingolipid hydroxylase (fatty acid hydroxylase superfamily)
MNYQLAIVIVFALFAIKEAHHSNLFRKTNEVKSDSLVEISSTLALLTFIQPLVLFSAAFIMSIGLPEYKGALSTSPILLQIFLLLIFDDLAQYIWHRASHSHLWLYKLHRAHHNAKYMSVRIIYRNNFFYYLLMPSLWFSGILIYLGLGWVYAFYLVIKLTVITGAHADWKWDKALYRNRYTTKLMWLVERLISTPSTHSCHHGYDPDDGITSYKGNYGNLLFLWDVIFGTATINRKYPERYGVKGMRRAEWGELFLWPLVQTPKKKKLDDTKSNTDINDPTTTEAS